MINNVSDINGTEFTDEMVEDLWAEQLSDNQMLREELAQLDDLVTLNRILKAFDSYGKKQIIRAIQAIHSNLNQIYKQQARIMGIKVDPKDEYPDFIQVYSSIYSILRSVDQKFAQACNKNAISGSKIDYIMQHDSMRMKLIFIVRTIQIFFSASAFRAVYNGMSRLLNMDKEQYTKKGESRKRKGAAYAKYQGKRSYTY
jgi:hypothetical protein